MKKLILMVVTATTLILTSCTEEPPKRYKSVVSITTERKTYPVTITEHSSNGMNRTAGGAIIGGAIGLLTGTSIIKTAIGGGLVGAATSDGETSKTYTKMQTDVYYTIIFSDSTREYSTNYCYYNIGQKIELY